jgi:hypothetical protein
LISGAFSFGTPVALVLSREKRKRNRELEDLMDERHVVDKRSIKLEDVMKKDYIPFLGGRPERQTIVNKDDILNLDITLNTCSTVDEFLKKI